MPRLRGLGKPIGDATNGSTLAFRSGGGGGLTVCVGGGLGGFGLSLGFSLGFRLLFWGLWCCCLVRFGMSSLPFGLVGWFQDTRCVMSLGTEMWAKKSTGVQA